VRERAIARAELGADRAAKPVRAAERAAERGARVLAVQDLENTLNPADFDYFEYLQDP
jgi:hypothetical protein